MTFCRGVFVCLYSCANIYVVWVFVGRCQYGCVCWIMCVCLCGGMFVIVCESVCDVGRYVCECLCGNMFVLGCMSVLCKVFVLGWLW